MNFFEYIDQKNTPYDIFYSNSIHSAKHWHYYSEILYILKGSIKLICNDYSFILEPGDICYIYPLQLHEVEEVLGSSSDVEYAVIKFDELEPHTRLFICE